jgi:hypothetical protein
VDVLRCPGDFADVTVDFQPWEDGFAFEVADSAAVEGYFYPEALPGFHAALPAPHRSRRATCDGATPCANTSAASNRTCSL